MLGQPLIAPTTFGGRQYEGEPQGMLLPRTVILRGGISVTEDEDYKCISSTIKVMAYIKSYWR